MPDRSGFSTMHPMSTKRLALGAAALVLATAACTGPSPETTIGPRRDLSLSSPSTAAAAPGANDNAASPTQATTGAGPAPLRTRGSIRATAPAAPDVAVPVTEKTITIGVRTLDPRGIEAFEATFGRSIGETPRQRDAVQSVIDQVNANGGIGGRRIVPVWQEEIAARYAAKPDDADQKACVAFTEQAHVFAAISLIPVPGVLYGECLAKHGVINLWSPLASLDAEWLDTVRDRFYMSSNPESSRMVRFWVDTLRDAGWFRTQPHVGVVWFDDRYDINQRTVQNALLPALKDIGVAHAKDVRVPRDEIMRPTTYSQAAAQMKAAGVDRVLILDATGLLGWFFLNAAEQQQYTPAYGLTSYSMGASLAGAPRRQLENITLVSWLSSFDVATAQAPTPTAAERQCLDVVRRGSGAALKDALARASAFWSCDAVWLLERAGELAPALTVAGFAAGVEAIGTWHQLGTFGARLGPGRHDGPTAVRLVRFDDGCGCLAYRGPVHSVD